MEKVTTRLAEMIKRKLSDRAIIKSAVLELKMMEDNPVSTASTLKLIEGQIINALGSYYEWLAVERGLLDPDECSHDSLFLKGDIVYDVSTGKKGSILAISREDYYAELLTESGERIQCQLCDLTYHMLLPGYIE